MKLSDEVCSCQNCGREISNEFELCFECDGEARASYRFAGKTRRLRYGDEE